MKNITTLILLILLSAVPGWANGIGFGGGGGRTKGISTGSDGTYGLLMSSNASSYSDCSAGLYGLNFVGGTLYQCINGTNSVFAAGSGDSWVVSAATPSFSPVAGTYTSTQSVTASCSSGTAYCSANGSTLVSCSGMSVSASGTRYARCEEAGKKPVNATAAYVINAACSTTADNLTGTTESALGWTQADNDSSVWIYNTFTAGSSYTTCGFTANLLKVGSPGGTLTACLYTDSAGVPGTQIACSNSVNVSSLSTTESTISFSSLTASLTSGTVYHGVIKSSQHNDWSNYVSWAYAADYVSNAIGICTSAGTCTASVSRKAKFSVLR